jgi:hypothetical protein
MTRLELARLPWECTFGGKSHLNIFGKIIFSPLIVILCTTISTCEVLFSKGETP